ncbi:MAG: leucyl/phenylalanyl-tRNA--protein transferase [Phycisphaerales bacterium]|nr:leucyl/phenylalanyl-tRNA--protein transferase [Phycisphaerales bacterium]
MSADPPFSPELVLYGYQVGVFPMDDGEGNILWFSPDPRCVIEFDDLRVSKSLRQRIRRNEFDIRIDTVFRDVIATCAVRPEGTWISDQIVDVYSRLHEAGFAHSVEAWRDDELVGGLYGVAIGGAFFGESMFHRATDASKVALVALIERLRERGYTLLDSQWTTPHLTRMGASEISRDEYLARLREALRLECRFA